MVKDRDEIMRRAIGYLTLAHNAVQRGELTDAAEQAIAEALASLREDVFAVGITIDSVPPESAEVARRVGNEVAADLMDRSGLLTCGFIWAFLAVVREYQRDCPGVDIGAILQRASISVEDAPSE